ncbi:Bud-site selection protein [Choiromyces venosus 120613-1]|uniref:Bud-site selection protein n=1 Tax=Choiromyces venosus 120613-1 TaxID=1336337 RepID=A0A3N4JED7_9PEZI|nr:Bud-site selection protein [Choiromyces venosus 120613-1]
MPKRKNPFTNNAPSSSSSSSSSSKSPRPNPALPARAHAQARAALLSALPSFQKRIFRALKKARGFETVKLIRRIKSSRTAAAAPRPAARLEEELGAVKGVRLDLLARAHLKRLCGARVVREVIGEVLGGVWRILGVDGEEGKGGGGGEEQEGKRKIEERLGRVKDVGNKKEEKKKKKKKEEVKPPPASASASDNEGSDSEDEEEEEGPGEEDTWKTITSAGQDAFSAFDARIASSPSPSASSNSSGDSQSDSEEGPYHHATDEEWSGAEEEEEDESSTLPSTSPPAPVQKPPKKPTTTTKEKPGTSTFLPTLLTGYISSSSDTPHRKHKKGPPGKKQRKNRMGQQARRALWAKKYGQNAAHIKQEVQIEERRQGERKGKKDAQTEGKLHPSWEAARKAREGKMAVVQEVLKGGGGGGKKVVFD